MHRRVRTFISKIEYLGLLTIALAACGDETTAPASQGLDASEVRDTTGQPDTTGGTGINTDPTAVATRDVDGHSRTTVAASSSTLWTHLSLTTGALAVPAPAGDDPFHLGFQRYLVRLGDGVSVLTLDAVAFASLTAAPRVDEGEWRVDGGTPETAAISDWWDYDGRTHVLTAKPDRLYVVSADGRFFKVRFRDYYDQSGNPGLVTLDWAEIAGPEVSGE